MVFKAVQQTTPPQIRAAILLIAVKTSLRFCPPVSLSTLESCHSKVEWTVFFQETISQRRNTAVQPRQPILTAVKAPEITVLG